MRKEESAEINQGLVNKAFRELDWPALEAHLRSVRLGSAAQQILIGLVRRADALIIKRLDPARRISRDEFASRLVDFIRKSCGPKVARTVDRHLESIKRIDGIYANILALVEESDAAKLTPALRIAALLSRSAQEHQSFMRDVFAYNEAIGPEPFTAKGVTAEGRLFDSNAVRDAMIAAIGSTVLMEAYTHSWFDAEGMVCLPPLPLADVSDQDRFCVGTTQMLAATWWKWEQVERRARYGGGELHWYDSRSLPDWARSLGAGEAVELKLNVRAASVDRIANQRLFHKMEQNFLQLLIAGADKKAAGIAGVVPLLPDAFVSASEVHAADALHSALSYDLIGDTERIKGVRLVEWLRGYATLHELIVQRVTEGDPSTEVLLFPKIELISLLTSMGLVGGIAERFIDAVTFSRSSRDLYDNPLVKCGDDYVVFAPAIAHLNIARVMLSAVSMHGAKLKKKGLGFERRVRDLIDRNGHKAYAFKAKRGDEEYEVDAMFVWGDRAFLLECKNRTLSGNHPVQTHYFEQETRSHAAQVNRILSGLRMHPDILATHCPPAVGKRIVACVVNAPPFSLPGGLDGVYMTDFSALHRFFEDPYLGVFAVAEGDIEHAERQAPTSAVSMWKSETGPTPDDLEEMMRLTPQFELHEALLSVTHTDVQYSHTGVFRAAELLQQDINADTVSATWRKIGRPMFKVVAKQNTSGTGKAIGAQSSGRNGLK